MLSLLKSILLAFLVIGILQVKVYDQTLEDRLVNLYKESIITKQINSVAQGAVSLSKDVGSTVSAWAYSLVGVSPQKKSETSDGISIKASRLNLELKRHPKALAEQEPK
jgi:hypothetical protein